MAEYSCVPMRPDFRTFVIRSDFQMIAHNNVNAVLLCVAEMKTNSIITYLRKRDGLPEGALPPEEDRWFELTVSEVATMTCGIYSRSTYANFLQPEGHKGIPSLLLLGFLRRRFVAYRGISPKPVDTKIYRNIRGRRYIVVDQEGCYRADDGTIHSAVKEGYTAVSRQFLLVIDEVNAALAALDTEDY